ncbi:MAG TPA: hypothetical protein DEQ27_01045, partial [Prevotella sp.]|nr:hypothetical protein [Prevotella sp.]
IGKAPINGYEVLTGPHTFKAVLNASQVDEQTINVISQSVIELQPVKKGNVEIFTKYAGRPVSAELVVDNQNSYNEQNSYRINLPYGWHSLRVTYGSKSKEKRIHINKPELSHTFKLSAKNDFVWPWQREYDTAPLGFTLSYVYKQLVTKGENERLKENGVWDDGKGKSLHGIQAGINLQPCFKFGLGLYTGLFYEFYYSSNDNYDYDKFMEHCGYIPVHLYYQIPFAKKIALSTHGGLGFSYAFYGMYKPKDDTYDNMTDFYGKDYYPKRFNMTMDIGASLRLGPIQLNFQYSKGINDHKSYSILGDYKTTQNKYTIGISTAISGN